jgi:hypothetical protein
MTRNLVLTYLLILILSFLIHIDFTYKCDGYRHVAEHPDMGGVFIRLIIRMLVNGHATFLIKRGT